VAGDKPCLAFSFKDITFPVKKTEEISYQLLKGNQHHLCALELFLFSASLGNPASMENPTTQAPPTTQICKIRLEKPGTK
jgi:hypothetical protein